MTSDLHYAPYPATLDVPNIVVDGAPNDSTVLTLTHWPGIPQPAGLGADVSAEMAFLYLDQPVPHAPASVVTNNHFDQDGLVSMYALINPAQAQADRERLIDVARAGDFATYSHRESARASMALWSYAQSDRSPLGSQLDGPYDDAAALLYETTLPLLQPMLQTPDKFREFWGEEDAALSRSEQAIASGAVRIDERPDIDLAVVTVDPALGLVGGHRFGSERMEMIHPMAINNTTSCLRLLLIRGQDYMYVDRYETWVQYVARRPLPRVDLQPLEHRLQNLETGSTSWIAMPPSTLSPTLRSDGESTCTPSVVSTIIAEYLETAPAAWDPYTA